MSMREVYLRFKDDAALTEFFKRPEAASIFDRGFRPLPALGGDVNELPDEDELLDISGQVAIVVVPKTETNSGVWVVLRLLGETSDLGIQSIRSNGAATTHRGAGAIRMTFGNKWVEVYDAQELLELGILPHVIFGGPL